MMRFPVLAVMLGVLGSHAALAQWEPDVRLTSNAAWSYLSAGNAWCVASNDSLVHVVWYDRRDFNYEIYHKRSTDNGDNWGTDTRLTSNSLNSEQPAVAVSGDTVHVVWQDDRPGDYDVYYVRSTDGGATWGTGTRLTTSSRDSRYPSIAVLGQAVHVVWQDERDGSSEVYHKRSTDGGGTWEPDIRLSAMPDSSLFPSVSVAASAVHVTWSDKAGGRYRPRYRRSQDGGASWEPDTLLSSGDSLAAYPSIAGDDSVVHVAWQDYRDGNPELYYRRSTDGGTSWSSETRLTDDSSYSYNASLAADGPMVHVVWRDGRSGNDEIFYKRSTDRGVTWETDLRLTDDPDQSRRASVALGSGSVHVVWCEGRDGNPEIYYKRNRAGSVAVGEDRLRQGPARRLPSTLVRGVLRLSESAFLHSSFSLLNSAGRQVADLLPGANDVRHLGPGVYFVQRKGPRGQGTEGPGQKVVVTR